MITIDWLLLEVGLTHRFSEIASKVNVDRLREYLNSIVGIRHHEQNPEHLVDIVQFLSNHMRAHGFVVSEEEFPYRGHIGINIVGTKRGASSPEEIYIIGAHYDTVPESPGADDNGTGIAGLMEIARILGNYQLKHTVELVAFGLEEENFVGSIEYSEAAFKRNDQIKGVFILEMIGYATNEPDTQTLPPGFKFLFPEIFQRIASKNSVGDFIAVVSNSESKDLSDVYQRVARHVVAELAMIPIPVSGVGMRVPDFRRSDHASFWDRGYPALMLTDTANFRNPNYHMPTDTVETINFEFFKRVVKSVVATIAHLAGIQND